MKGMALVLGVLLLLGGGAVAGIQFVSGLNLPFLETIPGAKEFLDSKTALYAGAGAAGFGLVMFIVGILPGGRKSRPIAREPIPERAESRPEPPPRPAPRPAPQPAPVGPAP